MVKPSCAITGHNPQRFKFKYNEEAPLCRKIKSAIEEKIKELYSNGIVLYYTGCAVGVDTWAAEVIIELQKHVEFSDMELFCAIPFPEHSEKFTSGQKKRYQNILNQCTYKEIINRHYSPVAYKRLNYFLIDKAESLLAVYDQDKSQRSGLVQMVNYAVKNHRYITFINPDSAVISDYIY